MLIRSGATAKSLVQRMFRGKRKFVYAGPKQLGFPKKCIYSDSIKSTPAPVYNPSESDPTKLNIDFFFANRNANEQKIALFRLLRIEVFSGKT